METTTRKHATTKSSVAVSGAGRLASVFGSVFGALPLGVLFSKNSSQVKSRYIDLSVALEQYPGGQCFASV